MVCFFVWRDGAVPNGDQFSRFLITYRMSCVLALLHCLRCAPLLKQNVDTGLHLRPTLLGEAILAFDGIHRGVILMAYAFCMPDDQCSLPAESTEQSNAKVHRRQKPAPSG